MLRRRLVSIGLLWLALASVGVATVAGASFVTRRGTQLIADGKPFYFVGGNAHWLTSSAGYSDQAHRVPTFFQRCQALDIKVIRVWAFTHDSPASAGHGSNRLTYNPREMGGLDYLVQQAGVYGIRLILAIGNLWPEYVGPEVFLSAAGESGDLLGFYSSSKARALYKQHISTIVTRRNTLTGVPYNQDPTIMGWDVLNEPRCPGCVNPGDKAVHDQWLAEMVGAAAAAAPSQLILLGTEGYFGAGDTQQAYNPGAGAACEGDDWRRDSALPAVSAATAHIYWRQTEGHRGNGWYRLNYPDYLSWFAQYLDLHISGAQALGKPFILEEFNVIAWNFSPAQRNTVLQLAFDRLAASKASGGPFAGAMVWSLALGGVPDQGYNIYIDQPIPPAAATTPAPPSPPSSTRATSTRTVSRSLSDHSSSPSGPPSPPRGHLLHLNKRQLLEQGQAAGNADDAVLPGSDEDADDTAADEALLPGNDDAAAGTAEDTAGDDARLSDLGAPAELSGMSRRLLQGDDAGDASSNTAAAPPAPADDSTSPDTGSGETVTGDAGNAGGSSPDDSSSPAPSDDNGVISSAADSSSAGGDGGASDSDSDTSGGRRALLHDRALLQPQAVASLVSLSNIIGNTRQGYGKRRLQGFADPEVSVSNINASSGRHLLQPQAAAAVTSDVAANTATQSARTTSRTNRPAGTAGGGSSTTSTTGGTTGRRALHEEQDIAVLDVLDSDHPLQGIARGKTGRHLLQPQAVASLVSLSNLLGSTRQGFGKRRLQGFEESQVVDSDASTSADPILPTTPGSRHLLQRGGIGGVVSLGNVLGITRQNNIYGRRQLQGHTEPELSHSHGRHLLQPQALAGLLAISNVNGITRQGTGGSAGRRLQGFAEGEVVESIHTNASTGRQLLQPQALAGLLAISNVNGITRQGTGGSAGRRLQGFAKGEVVESIHTNASTGRQLLQPQALAGLVSISNIIGNTRQGTGGPLGRRLVSKQEQNLSAPPMTNVNMTTASSGAGASKPTPTTNTKSSGMEASAAISDRSGSTPQTGADVDGSSSSRHLLQGGYSVAGLLALSNTLQIENRLLQRGGRRLMGHSEESESQALQQQDEITQGDTTHHHEHAAHAGEQHTVSGQVSTSAEGGDDTSATGAAGRQLQQAGYNVGGLVAASNTLQISNNFWRSARGLLGRILPSALSPSSSETRRKLQQPQAVAGLVSLSNLLGSTRQGFGKRRLQGFSGEEAAEANSTTSAGRHLLQPQAVAGLVALSNVLGSTRQGFRGRQMRGLTEGAAEDVIDTKGSTGRQLLQRGGIAGVVSLGNVLGVSRGANLYGKRRLQGLTEPDEAESADASSNTGRRLQQPQAVAGLLAISNIIGSSRQGYGKRALQGLADDAEVATSNTSVTQTTPGSRHLLQRGGIGGVVALGNVLGISRQNNLYGRRKLHIMEVEDGFRRGPHRAACAREAARSWQPATPPRIDPAPLMARVSSLPTIAVVANAAHGITYG